MSMPRRSSRNAYQSLEQLQARARAAAAATGDLWTEEDFADEEDDSFDEADESEHEDVVDSDFDVPEDVARDTEGLVAERDVRTAEMREQRTKRRGKYVDPALKKARTTGTGVPARPKKSKSSSSGAASSASARASLRKSTKVASAIAAEERERRKKKDEARRRRREQRETEQGKKTEVMPTQEELLAECAETEVKNAESLKELLRLEEEKKRVVVRKKRDVGQVISVRSRAGKQSVSFPKGVDAQKEMFG